MAGRVVVRGGRNTRVKRKTFWIGAAVVTVESTLAAGTTVLDSSLSAAALALRPFTVIRTLGLLSVASDQTASTEQPFGALGILVVDDRAVAAGAGSIARPYSESFDSDFFMHQFWSTKTQVATAASITGNAYTQFLIDQRGQRKVSIGNDIVVMMQNNESGDAVVFQLSLRMLCLAN